MLLVGTLLLGRTRDFRVGGSGFWGFRAFGFHVLAFYSIVFYVILCYVMSCIFYFTLFYFLFYFVLFHSVSVILFYVAFLYFDKKGVYYFMITSVVVFSGS